MTNASGERLVKLDAERRGQDVISGVSWVVMRIATIDGERVFSVCLIIILITYFKLFFMRCVILLEIFWHILWVFIFPFLI